MKPTDNFSEIKQEILDRARRAEACRPEYGRAYAAETLGDLCTVIKDNYKLTVYWQHEVVGNIHDNSGLLNA